MTVLLAVAAPELAERVRSALSDPRQELVVLDCGANGRAVDLRRPPDVVLVDEWPAPQLPKMIARRIDRGGTAIVLMGVDSARGDSGSDPLGGNSQAEVAVGAGPRAVLPLDATPREIAQCCRLLAENARLRQRLVHSRRRRGELARLAELDPLTGLPNRRAWDRELMTRLRAKQQTGGMQCLAILDLDGFKRVNDTHGFADGDRLLAAAGKALRHAVRTGDYVARLGGDEFGLLLANVAADNAAAVVDRVRGRLGADPALAQEQITASAGFVLFAPRQEISGATLLAAADRALRAAKSQGRNCTVDAGK